MDNNYSSKSLPDPCGVWKARDSIADINEQDAAVLTNFIQMLKQKGQENESLTGG